MSMLDEGLDDDTDVFDVESHIRGDQPPRNTAEPEPLFRIYKDSKIAIGKHVGAMWQKRWAATVKAYEEINKIWDEVFKYYNNAQTKQIDTPRGIFRRGDCTENVIFSNLNITLPAVYGKDPDITCSTSDQKDEPFCQCLQALINTLFRRRQSLNAKPKIKRASGMGLLTNLGILKLDFTHKDDSREYAITELEKITGQLTGTEDIAEAERLYGELEALEMQLEVRLPSGPTLGNVLPFNLLVDPYAEQLDGSDSAFMIERAWIATGYLTARFTEPDPDSDDPEAERVLIYKPTHKAQFAAGAGSRDDGIGIVLTAIDAAGVDLVKSNTEDERTAYINMYFTECYWVWDKLTRRLMLFHRDDWKWPIWVWDDPLKITRFFPYFLIAFTMSTGGVVSAGETAYILDQQDEINDINRKLARIRRSVFDFVFFNSDAVNEDDVDKFIKALRGDTTISKHALGIRAGDKKISEFFQVLGAPELEYESLFDKKGILDAINRITNTSDALRGVQFKTNTNVAAVNTYQESLRLSVGSKVDVIEDTVADLAASLAELCIQFYTKEDVAGLIGEELAKGWQQMSVADFNAKYNLTLVAGSMEKPNSVFKKKEAIEIAQAIGQFASAAPGATLTIVIRLLQQAFSEVVVKPEDWAALRQEIQANLQKGVSTDAGVAGGQGGQQPGQGGEDIVAQLPPEVKQHVQQMLDKGATEQEVAAYVQQHLNSTRQSGGAPTGAQANGR